MRQQLSQLSLLRLHPKPFAGPDAENHTAKPIQSLAGRLIIRTPFFFFLADGGVKPRDSMWGERRKAIVNCQKN